MPAFGRHSKSNRPPQAPVESLASGGTAAAGSGAGSGPPLPPLPSVPATTASSNPHSASPTAFSPGEQPPAPYDRQQQQQQVPLQQQELHRQQLQLQQQQSQLTQLQQDLHGNRSREESQGQQPQASQSSQSSLSQHDQQAPLPPVPPPHLYSANLHNPNSILDPRSKQHPDFSDAVSRSQSQRYPPAHTIPPQYPLSSSADDLSTTLANQGAPPYQQLQQSQQQQQVPLPEAKKRGGFRALRTILGGSSTRSGPETQSQQQQQPNPPPVGTYDNTRGLARRPSKRDPNPQPASLRTGSSQISIDSQAADWQQQAQTSPLQGVGEVDERYFEQEPGFGQNPRDLRPPTLRRVPTDHETSPYGNEDPAYQQQQALNQAQAVQDPRIYSQTDYEQSQQQQQHYQFANQSRGQFPGPPPQIYTQHLGKPVNQNPETVSQLSHESPVTDAEQRSATLSAQTSPAVNFATQESTTPHPNSASVQPTSSPIMVPPPGGQPPRRSQDTKEALRSQADVPPGPPPGYRHSQQPINQMGPITQTTGGQSAPYRGSSADRPAQYDGSGTEQGRNSPQPSADREGGGDPDKAFKDLLTKYKNVKRLYFDGKAQIETLTHQVETLQNAIANQRMSQSRTALDDNEYSTRFNRLNGAINNLSFNIRKDWRHIPQWLEPYVSADALKTGKQEMTAVGRAVIARWVADEIFNCCFHPGLNAHLSGELKDIETNIRRFSYTMNSQEEFEALTAKVVSWRMATLEGLQQILQSAESATNRANFTRDAVHRLSEHLHACLVDPPPTGVEGSASMIVELAVGIAANLPMESRDVAISYPLPGDIVQPHLMEVEKTPLPPLDDSDDAEEEEGGDGKKEGSGSSKDRRGDKPRSTKEGNAVKVRMAGFVAVEVRGRQVLMKSPIWTL